MLFLLLFNTVIGYCTIMLFTDRGGDGDIATARGSDVVGTSNLTVGGGAGHGGFGGASDYDNYLSGNSYCYTRMHMNYLSGNSYF